MCLKGRHKGSVCIVLHEINIVIKIGDKLLFWAWINAYSKGDAFFYATLWDKANAIFPFFLLLSDVLKFIPNAGCEKSPETMKAYLNGR